MKFKLKTDGKVKYSKGELAAFKTLSNKPKSSSDIVAAVYAGVKDVPYNSRKIVIGMIASLKRKMATNKESFKIVSAGRLGPHPTEFWLEGK